MIFDFGIGNSMVSRVAGLAAQSEWATLRKLIISGLSCARSHRRTDGCRAGESGGVRTAFLAVQRRRANIDSGGQRHVDALWRAVRAVDSVASSAPDRPYLRTSRGAIFRPAPWASWEFWSLLGLPLRPRLHAGIASLLLITYGLQVGSGVILLVALHRRFNLALPRFAELRESKVRDLTSGWRRYSFFTFCR